jgi:hypothetical protein
MMEADFINHPGLYKFKFQTHEDLVVNIFD